MTCIVGLSENGAAYIGGDSCATDEWSITVIRTPKVFRNGLFIIGYTSSFRMGQVLRHHLSVPLQTDVTDEVFLTCTFIEAVRACLKEYGFAEIKDNQEKGGTFILAYKGQIYRIDSDYQILQPADGLAACGCGDSFALGAMCALRDILKPKERIKRALEITSHYSAFVKAPFHVLSSP